MRKFIKKTIVTIMTAAMVVSSFGAPGIVAKAAGTGYVLQNKTVQQLMKEYGVIAFDQANLEAHFHSNFMVNHLYMTSNSGLGSTYGVTEAFYFNDATQLNASISEANTNDVLYTSSQVTKMNGVDTYISVVGGGSQKVDRPQRIVTDAEIAAAGIYAQYVNLNDVKSKFVTYNQKIAAQPDSGTVDIKIGKTENGGTLQVNNNRYVQVGAGENYRNISYNDLVSNDRNPIKFVFSSFANETDTLVVNVDLKGQSDVTFGELTVSDSTSGNGFSNQETNYNSTYNRVYFNFYDSSKANKQYTGKITFAGRGFGTIIAPNASVSLSQNWDGMVVADDVQVDAQFHRVNGINAPVPVTSSQPTTEATTQKTTTEEQKTETTTQKATTEEQKTEATTQKATTEEKKTETTTERATTEEKKTEATTEKATTEEKKTEATTEKEKPSSSNESTDLTINVQDEETDEPVPGATVEITTPDGEKTQHVTDEDGNVTIKDAPEGDYKVVIKDVPEEYNVTTNKEVKVTVKKGKATKKTVTKKKNTAYRKQVKKDAKNASKAMKWAAAIKTGDDAYAQAVNVDETDVAQYGAKNNKSISKKYNKNLKNFKKKYKKQSKEVAAWISISGTKINYPVMYTGLKNNTKYLQKNIKGEKDTHGMLFASYMTPKRKITYNSVIYGHNMKDGTMFTDLTKYASKSFYNTHKYVKFSTQGYNYVYEVVEVARVSCKTGSKDRMIYQKFCQLNNKKTFKKWQKQVAKNREYKCSGKYKRTDKLLMLSTCEYTKENGRFIVICKQIKCKKVK